MHCSGFVWGAGDGSPGLWGSRGPIWGSGMVGWGGWRLAGRSLSPPPPQIPIQPCAVWLPSAAVLLGWVQDLVLSLQREGKEAQAELAFGICPSGPTPGVPAAPMGAKPPSTLSPGRLGTAGGTTMVLPLGQDPSLGQISVPVAFRKRHNRQHLLKMIKSKENHPPKKSQEQKDLGSQLYTTPQGWSHLSPPPLTKLVPSRHRWAGSIPRLFHHHPQNLGYCYRNPLPYPLNRSLTLVGSLLRALSGLGSDHGVGDSLSFIMSPREVAPPRRWSSSTPAGPILPTSAPRTSKGVQD